MVGEQPYKNRDMAGSDSGLGHLLVNTLFEFTRSNNICESEIKSSLGQRLYDISDSSN